MSTRPVRTAVVRPPWPQLELFSIAPAIAIVPQAPAPAQTRWSFTRPWLVSPHLARARRELDGVRDHFPELDGVTVRVGLTKRRGVLGLASLGEEPLIWIRPRRFRRFAIAHELVHLLQARGLVPGDSGALRDGAAEVLHAIAARAIERARGARTGRGAVHWFHAETKR